MQALLEAGVAINDALQALAKESESHSFRAILSDIKLQIEAGESLSVALNKYPRVFSKQMTSLIKAGEFSGKLGAAFAETARHLEWTEAIISDLKQVSIYPLMVISALLLFALLLFGFVVPTFAELLGELKIELPLITRIILALGSFVGAHWFSMLSVPVIALGGCALARYYSYPFARWVHQRQLELPVVGGILTMAALSRFSHNMAMLLRAGLTLQRALHLSRPVVANLAVADAIKDAELAVNDGAMMSDALRRHRCFSPSVMRIIVVGEESGDIARSFENISSRFDKEIPRRIKRFLSLLEPAMVLSLIMLVGTVAMAIFLPFLDLMGGIL